MATTIKLKNSVTTTAAPSSLVQGEVATNITDKKVWVGDASSTPVQILGAGAPVAGTTGTFTGNVSVAGAFSANGGATLGDASGDALTINSSAVSIPNGLNFDSNTLVIDATNNRVGIGTASPASTLNIETSTTSVYLKSTGSTACDIEITGGNRGAGSASFLIRQDNAGNGYLYNRESANLLFGTAFTERMRITSAGNVGIGTSSPAATNKFQVSQTSTTDGATAIVASCTGVTTGANYGLYSSVSGATVRNWGLYVQAGDAYVAGNVGIGTSSPVYKLDVNGIINSNSSIRGTQVLVTNTNGITLSDDTASGFISYGYNSGRTNAASHVWYNGITTERMRLDSSGNLGLGVTPSSWNSLWKPMQLGLGASVSGRTDNASIVYLQANTVRQSSSWLYLGTGNATSYEQSSGSHIWSTAASGTAGNAITFTQAMTLDASGTLFLTGTSAQMSHTQGGAVIYGTTPTNGGGIYPGLLELIDTRDYNSTGPQPGGGITFAYKYNASGAYGAGPSIQGFKENSTDGDYAGGLRFLTRPNGASPAERMRIDSSGNLLIGTTTARTGTNSMTFEPGNNYFMMRAPGTGSLSQVAFIRNTAGTPVQVGDINTNGSATSYNTSSDYRLKENIAPMTGALAKVSVLKPCTYTWKLTGENGEGFIAHELAQIVPNAVTGEKDAVDEEGNPKYQGIDTSFLVATLTAAIQELKAEVDALKAQINQ